MAGGAGGAAAVVDWQGPLRDMFSFTVLLSVFIGCEPGAAAAAAVSAAGAGLALVESSFQPLQALPGVSASQQLLLLLSSGLMVPRALLQCELMWFTGTARAAATITAMCLALLATCTVLQCGWLYMKGAGAAEAGG
ncbi:hypothetical protein OEZ85_011559 [Tetradesmus obliquus]|uniref:Uncharacterized protein n=1 Tax=Tetradesmus obliquus TaxID=3088 RepID=A0ABY8TR16_TETOB|nr:hypothetical protein OEZ85_011559 [Tetradesmus obliquus]